MKIIDYHFPKSGFLSIEKDYALIIDKILNNSRIMKLLYYDTNNALDIVEDLNQSQVQEVLDTKIKLVPKVYIDGSMRSYIVINFDSFEPNRTNPEFRDNLIYFDIVCHVEQWMLQDFQLRPYKIAGEIDSMFNNQKLTGIGVLEFLGSQQVVVNEDYIAISLLYRAVHGEEDKIHMLNPQDEEQFIQDFEEMYNE